MNNTTVDKPNTPPIKDTSFINNPNIPAARTPKHAAQAVISLFSNAYSNRPIDTWSADWDNADVDNAKIKNNDIKCYTDLIYAGIEFTTNQINASAATHLHIDIWTPNATTFKIKLVDFGDNAIYQGTTNDDSEHELSFIPAQGSWVSYDIPLSDFKGLKARAHLAQMILVGSNSQVYVDNVYFYDSINKNGN